MEITFVDVTKLKCGHPGPGRCESSDWCPYKEQARTLGSRPREEESSVSREAGWQVREGGAHSEGSGATATASHGGRGCWSEERPDVLLMLCDASDGHGQASGPSSSLVPAWTRRLEGSCESRLYSQQGRGEGAYANHRVGPMQMMTVCTNHKLSPLALVRRLSDPSGSSQPLAGDELEQIRPSVYRNVARQLHLSLQSEPVVTDAFLAVASHIFSAGITWGKVVSLYAVAAGLAVDCVRQAQPALVHALVDCLGEFVRKTLATWLRRRGGWTDILKCVVSADPGLRSHWFVAALCSFGRFLKAAFFLLLPER
ncbi:PREDICTED: bcl-2-related ovarian killer protein [Dipodomys ordii]|uniref:Bcl-2-related ovarian killer protein n=1 Tax=Dipodomys ordii TaxID=10020 RepID=A0A1S3GLI7_DIPOR|nr:PREDICTED: bcl-2-related ovarian killer protein [Dipodomys ordii]